MAALSLILALSALWTGPIWGQDRSWAGSIDPVRVSALMRCVTSDNCQFMAFFHEA